MKSTIFILLTFAGLNAIASTEAGKALSGVNQAWEKLGARTVTMTADHDEILVTAQEGVFTAIKLKILKAPIHITNINVIFGNGDNENIVLNQNYPAGSETRVIDLVGNKRIIRKVNLNYHSKPTQKGRAIVTLWGRH